MQLPKPIPPNRLARPVKLPTDCSIELDHQTVIAVGNGDKVIGGSHYWDSKIRHAYFRTTVEACEDVYNDFDRWSVICLRPNHGQCVNHGDSGV